MKRKEKMKKEEKKEKVSRNPNEKKDQENSQSIPSHCSLGIIFQRV